MFQLVKRNVFLRDTLTLIILEGPHFVNQVSEVLIFMSRAFHGAIKYFDWTFMLRKAQRLLVVQK